VAPSRTVSVSASVNLPLHHKVQKFSSGTGSPGWSRKKGRKPVVVCGGWRLQSDDAVDNDDCYVNVVVDVCACDSSEFVRMICH